jgi:TonB-dependent receptor
MRLKTFILCTTSAGVIALSAAPVMAQTAEQQPQAQEQPADPEAGAVQTDDPVQSETGADEAGAGEEIVVTGFRASLRSAQSLKRNSEQIIDAIVAEDIGKLPDLAVSDTAARIPGVQVIRTGGEASSVLIRGLPDFATTYNGREIFTAETRLVALQDFPSANIAALEVFKTTTPSLVEAGLAGLVNVRSRRPFDFKGLEIAGSVWALYTKQADEVTPNGNFLVSNRWDTGIGEIGILVNASYTQLKFLDSEPSNTDFLQTFRAEGNRLIADGNGQAARFPDIQRVFYREGDRTRPSVNVALQWRPNTELEFYFDGLYQGFRNKISDRLIAVPLFNGGAYSNLVFNGNLLQSGTITGLADPIFTFQGGTFNKTDTYQFAIGGSYESGPLRVAIDLARTDSTFRGSTESVDRIFRGQASTSVDFDLTTPQFTINNFDPTNPANSCSTACSRKTSFPRVTITRRGSTPNIRSTMSSSSAASRLARATRPATQIESSAPASRASAGAISQRPTCQSNSGFRRPVSAERTFRPARRASSRPPTAAYGKTARSCASSSSAMAAATTRSIPSPGPFFTRSTKRRWPAMGRSITALARCSTALLACVSSGRKVTSKTFRSASAA